MSLEQVLQANTDAITALTKALIAGQLTPLATGYVKTEVVKSSKAEVKKPEAEVAEPKVEIAEPKVEIVEAKPEVIEAKPRGFVPEVEEAAKDLTPDEVEARRSDVRVVVLTLAKKNRDEATALLQRHGVEGISKILPEHFNSVIKLGRQIIEGKASALESADEAGME